MGPSIWRPFSLGRDLRTWPIAELNTSEIDRQFSLFWGQKQLKKCLTPGSAFPTAPGLDPLPLPSTAVEEFQR